MSREVLLGVDLGGTNCRGALVTAGGERLSFRRIATRTEDGLGPFLDRLAGFCRELVSAARTQGFRASAIGIGVPGVISGGVVRSSPNLPLLDGVDLAAMLRQRLELPVTVVNDANAIAWGEFLFGAGRDFRSFLTLTLGTGVGGALVLDRRLWEGVDGAAGEVGHITVVPDGRLCGCGNHGCLERYASATGIVVTAREALAAGEASVLGDLGGEKMTSRQVADAARLGDRPALAALEEAGRRIGQVIAGVANLLNLEGALITGGASESLDLMREPLEQEIAKRAFAVPARRLKIVRGELGDVAGILGAAGLAVNLDPKALS